jgi:hypothetical protein
MTPRKTLYLVLSAFLFSGEAAAKDKRDGAPQATQRAATGAASELKRWPKPPPPPPCIPRCFPYAKATENNATKQPVGPRTPNVQPQWPKNDRPGGSPAPYPNRRAR